MTVVRRQVPLLILTCLILTPTLSGATLHLKKREVNPDAKRAHATENVALEAPGPRWAAGRSHVILQFRHPVNEQIVQELNRRGAYVVGAVPDFGVMVSIGDSFSLEGLGVQLATRLELGDKISPLLDNPRVLENPRMLENPQGRAETWVIAEFFPDVDMHNAVRLARAAGFQVRSHPDLLKTHLLLSGDAERLTGLAQWDEVAYIFPASKELVHGDRVMACAGALTSGGATAMYVTASSGWPKDSNGQVTLSYVFGPLPPNLDPAQATQEILLALNSWTQYAPIDFVAGQSATSDQTIYVWFATYDHGDGYPFDGPGGILAHTFYPAPPNPEAIAGDMHLDGSEYWRIGADTDLYTVAVHEAGHALGLAHVDDPTALMYPYYRLGSKIAAGDIAGVQSLYGTPLSSSAPVTSAPVPAPPSNPTATLTVNITTPSGNATTSNSTVPLAGTTSGASRTPQITWQTDHSASGSATGTTQWTVAAVPLVAGSNTITVTAIDSSQKAVKTVIVTQTTPAPNPAPDPSPNPSVPVRGTAPSLGITSPAGNIVTTSAAMIDVIGTASASAGLSKVTWQSVAGSGDAKGTTNWTAAAIPLLVGDNTIVVRAYDTAGNTSWRSLLVIRD